MDHIDPFQADESRASRYRKERDAQDEERLAEVERAAARCIGRIFSTDPKHYGAQDIWRTEPPPPVGRRSISPTPSGQAGVRLDKSELTVDSSVGLGGTFSQKMWNFQ